MNKPDPGVATAGSTLAKLHPLAGLLPFIRPYRGRIVAALTALCIAAAATLALPLAVRHMIDLGFSADQAGHIDRYFVLMFAIASVLAVSTALRHYLVLSLGERIVADVRRRVYDHVLRMSPAFFEVTRSGEVLSRLTTDTTLVENVVGSSASMALRNLFLLAGGLTMLALTSARLTAYTLVLLVLVLVPIIFFARRVRALSRASQDRVADASAIAGEILNAIPTVHAHNREQAESERFGTAVEAAFTTAMARIRTRSLLAAIVVVMVFGAVVFVLWLGARSVLAGTLTGGQLGQFVLYAVIVAGSIGVLSEVWGDVQRAAGAAERIGELLAAAPQIRAPATPVALGTPRGDLRFDDVRFHYPSRPERPALDGVSLQVHPGDTVALVGPSGAGKSTLFQLILRFYDPQRGAVLLDGVDIRHADPAAVRERIGLVPQDTVIFSADAYTNIRYGRADASDEEVRAAARAAYADSFIEALPQGYRTFLGERGVRLSGGQRQRIAIARAILRNPPVLLLDEATSALDAESERQVQTALEGLMRDRTTLVIAHRLATVQQADRIVVLDEGRIVATGTHASLVREGGLYARLAALQFHASVAETQPVGTAMFSADDDLPTARAGT